MRLSHKLSDNHKVVDSKFGEGGAACGADGMCHGEPKRFDDGGDVEQPTYWGAVKDRVKDIASKVVPSGVSTPVAEQPKHAGKTYDEIVDEASK